MGNKAGLCDAITTPDVFIKLGTTQENLQKFYKKYPQIKNRLQKIGEYQKKNPLQKTQVRNFIQGIYIGSINSINLPETKKQQKGIFLYQSGFYYEGQFKNGKRYGQGRLMNQDGDYYEGNWIENNPQGHGLYQVAQSGRKYQGEWKQGFQHGKGFQKYQDGSFYQGQFFEGKKSGKGKLQYPDGTTYQGQFFDNKINGYGCSNGRFHKYEGEWKNGKMHGNGTSTWTDDKKQVLGHYVGQYKNGLKDGYGEYKWGQKKVYKGRWAEGDMSSQGVLLNYEA